MPRYIRRISLTSRQLLDDLRAARRRLLQQKDAEALHDLRVGIRRLRSTLLPLTQLPGMEAARQALKPFKKLADASNTLRDGEVQRLLLREHPLPDAGAAFKDWRHRQRKHDRQASRKLKQQLLRRRWKKRGKALEKQLRLGLSGHHERDVYAQLQSAYRALLDLLRRELADLTGLFGDAQRWHHVRLNCKRLRYLLESHGERLTANWQDQARYVTAAQDSLGELRDWEVLSASLLAEQVPIDAHWYQTEHALRRQRAGEDCELLAGALVTW